MRRLGRRYDAWVERRVTWLLVRPRWLVPFFTASVTALVVVNWLLACLVAAASTGADGLPVPHVSRVTMFWLQNAATIIWLAWPYAETLVRALATAWKER